MCNKSLSRDSIRRLIDSSGVLNQWISSLNADLLENEVNNDAAENSGNA
ncbi:unnamed protein product [Trichobilharzia regenti]|nr:unnamed protein product [Trichobilharzia regenti]